MYQGVVENNFLASPINSLGCLCSLGYMYIPSYSLFFPVTGYLDEVFSMDSLTQLERVAEIPVVTELEAKKRNFQAVIRVKQPDLSWAINKWLTAPVLSRIKPTWKNLLLVLQLIDLHQVAEEIGTYFKTHSPSSLKEIGGVMGLDGQCHVTLKLFLGVL